MAGNVPTTRVVVLTLLVLLATACGSQQSIRLAGGPANAASDDSGGATKHSPVDWSVSCTECHKEVTPDVTAAWYEGMHGQVNVKCYVCHGDGEVEFHPQPTDDRCIGCHSGKEASMAKVETTSCFSCHNGHTLRFHAD